MTFAEGFKQFNELIDELIANGMTEDEAIAATAKSGLFEKQRDLLFDSYGREEMDKLTANPFTFIDTILKEVKFNVK